MLTLSILLHLLLPPSQASRFAVGSFCFVFIVYDIIRAVTEIAPLLVLFKLPLQYLPGILLVFVLGLIPDLNQEGLTLNSLRLSLH